MKPTLFLALSVIVTGAALAAQEAAKPADPLLLESSVLRRHVQIVAIPSTATQTDGIDKVLLESDAWKALLIKEGVAIGRDEWAGAVDLLQTQASNSRAFRVVYGSPNAGKEGVDAAWILLARFGVGSVGKRAFLHLLEGGTRRTVVSAEATADSMEAAIHAALTELEDKTVLLPWYCAVVGVRDGAMVIDRGRLDGLHKGQKFFGYGLAPEASKSAVSAELLLMKFGTRKGIYEVSEEGQEFCLVKPVGDAPLLKDGDVLELPMVARPVREPDTRGHRTWDDIYRK
jgi:hypothetical protein